MVFQFFGLVPLSSIVRGMAMVEPVRSGQILRSSLPCQGRVAGLSARMPLPVEGRLFMGALFVVFPLTSHVLSATARDAATRQDLQLLAGQGRISGMTLAATDSLLVQQVMVC